MLASCMSPDFYCNDCSKTLKISLIAIFILLTGVGVRKGRRKMSCISMEFINAWLTSEIMKSELF